MDINYVAAFLDNRGGFFLKKRSEKKYVPYFKLMMEKTQNNYIYLNEIFSFLFENYNITFGIYDNKKRQWQLQITKQKSLLDLINFMKTNCYRVNEKTNIFEVEKEILEKILKRKKQTKLK